MSDPQSTVFHGDCMEFMARYPDNYFELAIVDPPYQLDGWHDKGNNKTRISAKEGSKRKLWDKKPKDCYFKELKRVSKNQIIWGGNYFNLGICVAPIIWDKKNNGVHFADGEFAWSSFKTGTLRMFRLACIEMLHIEKRIHPTQKPARLYEWLLKNYAKEGDKILDTHMGSQSSRIAAYKYGFDYWGSELDDDYFKSGCERFERESKQPMLLKI
jgi:site-specific DNA-methyltransferase (adenine-specific)